MAKLHPTHNSRHNRMPASVNKYRALPLRIYIPCIRRETGLRTSKTGISQNNGTMNKSAVGRRSYTETISWLHPVAILGWVVPPFLCSARYITSRNCVKAVHVAQAEKIVGEKKRNHRCVRIISNLQRIVKVGNVCAVLFAPRKGLNSEDIWIPAAFKQSDVIERHRKDYQYNNRSSNVIIWVKFSSAVVNQVHVKFTKWRPFAQLTTADQK